MTIEEQAAMYEAGVKASLEGNSMDKGYLSTALADGVKDHTALEALFTPDDGEMDARRKAYKERGAVLMRGVDDREYFPTLISSADWFGPEETVQGYAAADAAWAMILFERWDRARRFVAQRPLIHNGRKMKR